MEMTTRPSALSFRRSLPKRHLTNSCSSHSADSPPDDESIDILRAPANNRADLEEGNGGEESPFGGVDAEELGEWQQKCRL